MNDKRCTQCGQILISHDELAQEIEDKRDKSLDYFKKAVYHSRILTNLSGSLDVMNERDRELATAIMWTALQNNGVMYAGDFKGMLYLEDKYLV